jgi:hypothetical protein
VPRTCSVAHSGVDSAHYENFSAIAGNHGISYSPVRRGQGILRAALEDFEHGYLFDVRRLIESEVFADFLEQAGELLRAGYKGPSALVAGWVLEDALRRLCSRNGVPLPPRPKLDSMNTELAKAGVYNKLSQKRITAIAEIRNNAAHGKWEEFNGTTWQRWLSGSPSSWKRIRVEPVLTEIGKRLDG